ncbi:MAG: SUF system Fe-S cluster assembly protein [Deltaproteobacteria bacterium]|nr:SUF system Fe-S cluster assembly protein [Deltaproteobacteria bacterium]
MTETAVEPTTPPSSSEAQNPLEEKIIAALHTVYDPEIPVDIYELGLIYNIQPGDNHHVDIQMTLTSPACPVAGSLPGEVEVAVAGVDGVDTCAVELVWDPTWTPEMMSEAAKLELGFL